MNYQQLIQPNLSIVGQNGDCLEYVREIFGAPAEYPTAIQAWQNAIQHAEDPPANAVPIWFNWETDGHVAVWDDGTIYSTTAQGDKTFASIDELMSYIGGGIEYLGWSEDINSVRIVEEEDAVSTIGEVEFHDLFVAYFGPMVGTNQPTAGDRNRWIGAESNTVIREMQADPRTQAYAQYVQDIINAENSTPGYTAYSGPTLYLQS